MAVMYPQEINECLSDGERKVFNEFKDKLSDDWTVFYSLRWVTEDNFYTNKSNGEADFILVNAKYGVMILEIKGGRINCINGEWTSISQNNIKNIIKDPEKQANTSKFQLLSRFRKYNIKAYVTTAVCFPDSSLSTINLPLSMPEDIIIDINSFDHIEEKLIRIFKFRLQRENFDLYEMSMSDFTKVKNVLCPKVVSKISLKNKAKSLNFRYIKLNEEQSRCFEQLEDNRFISVKGHAGTGKTILALKKALKDSGKGKKVLYICYNTMLFDKMKEEAQDTFDVFCIYDFAEEYLRINHKEYYDEFQEEVDYGKMINHYMELCHDNKETENLVYDTILVDEGQDFEEQWFKSLYNFLERENGSLYVFYDELQMLYEKFGREKIDFLDIGVRYNLKRNMRNTDEICLSSLKVIGINEKEIMLKGINGINPEIVFEESGMNASEKLKHALKKLNYEDIQDEDITILIINPKEKLKYKKEVKRYSSCLVESVRKFKGLESDIIIIPDLKSGFIENDEIRKLLYVAMSRAKVHVILIVNTENMNRKQRVSYKKQIIAKLLSI